MKPDEIRSGDWLRIIFGEVPPEFYIELIIRGSFVYLLLMVSMRILGTRMAGQLSRLDMTAMVALASSIGVSILSPVNGLLPALIVATIIIAISKLISFLSVKSERIEKITQGSLDVLVERGVLRLNTMKRVRVTRERLFAQLRSSKISHLGKVNRLYMEADGNFSLVKYEQPRPGLRLIPDWDKSFIDELLQNTDTTVCEVCGEQKPEAHGIGKGKIKCQNCGSENWITAVIEK